MKKILAIARWEFIEKIKRRSFFLSMIITPLILFGLVYFSSSYTAYEKESPSPIGIFDVTGKYADQIIIELRKQKLNNGQPAFIIMNFSDNPIEIESQLQIADQMISGNDIQGFLYIHVSDSLHIEYWSGIISNPTEFAQIEEAVRIAITKYKLNILGFSSQQVGTITRTPNIIQTNTGDNKPVSEDEYISTFLTGYFFILLLLLMILSTGGMFVRSIVEEKSNRIIEVILSSCKIDQLLAGKILGLSWLGIFQIVIWMLIGGIIFGSDPVNLHLSGNFWWQIIFFILGYVLYTAIFVGTGSIVNTEHEAQQMTANLSIILVIPILIAAQVLLFPDSMTALILSYFPLTTAPAMILRLNIIEPSPIEIFFTITISIVSIYLVVRLSSKIFRLGILSYGRKPNIKELIDRLKSRNS